MCRNRFGTVRHRRSSREPASRNNATPQPEGVRGLPHRPESRSARLAKEQVCRLHHRSW
ncbi:hypothetical protein MINT15_15790 [Saccharomonospora viridis]|uniref:Uncharacterized protein n=1 Tax=Saccharomonospora viridis TaxID=1852 RepID=A0A837DAR7_9PSEU|nr:hypothetical protein MINT15_15790 [Saccharomonospora viridis]